MLHGEVTFLKNWIEWKPWEQLDEIAKTMDKKEFYFVNSLIIKNINI